jgi:hypothetical protein
LSFDAGRSQILALAHDSLMKSAVDDLPAKLKEIARNHFVDQPALRAAVIESWIRAVDDVLNDKLLDVGHEHALVQFQKAFELSQVDLDKGGAYMRLGKAAVLRDVIEGRVPNRLNVSGTIPFNLQKGETLIWLFNNTTCFETRSHAEYVGRSAGVSVRIAKGIYYHTSAFRGRPVQRSQVVQTGRGLLGVTNKNLYFGSAGRTFKIPYPKIVAFQQYTDGIGVQRDGDRAKPQVFQTGDGWFAYNLITNAAHL